MKSQVGQLAAEKSMRKTMGGGDMVWLLLDGIVRMVNQVIESPKFSTGIQRMKAVCVATSVEGCRQAVKEQVASMKFDP